MRPSIAGCGRFQFRSAAPLAPDSRKAACVTRKARPWRITVRPGETRQRRARPDSHAGTSILRKRALASPAYRHIDYVTLGSSRQEYGLDHETLATLAQRHGRVYANLSMPGSHWMTLDVLGDWLARRHPDVARSQIERNQDC